MKSYAQAVDPESQDYQDKSIIERIIKNEIVAYYDSLTEKIREKGYDRSQFFYLENENGHKEFICDILKDIYSLENVYNAIIQVQSDIKKMVPSALLVIKWELEVINWKKANFY